MKKKINYLTAIILSTGLFLSTGCSKTPEACFTADKGNTNTHINEEIHFDGSCSSDAESHSWDFGDGATATGVTTKHKYSTQGSYTVKLTVENGSKDRSTTQTMSIQP